jgi:Na+/H+-dicarboxylate symporter
MRKTTLHTILVLVALVAGAFVGQWLHGRGGPGQLWQEFGELVILRPLLLMTIPLVFVSVALGVASVGDPKTLGRLGGAAIAFYLSAMLLASALGATLVGIVRPGEGLPPETVAALRQQAETDIAADADRQARLAAAESMGLAGAWISIAKQAIPRNLIDEAAKGNTLAIVLAGIVFGAALGLGGERTRPVVAVLEGMFAAFLKVIGWILWFLPPGVFLLVAASVGRTGLGPLLGPLAGYMGTVLGGLLIHGLVVLPLMLLLLGGGNGWMLLWRVRRALLTAFGTSSSNATLPITLEACVSSGGCSRRATAFVIPLGATVNMAGTALYEAVAVLFLFQLFGADLSVAESALVVVASVLAAIGAAGIPAAGLVTMVIVIGAANAAAASRGIEPLPIAAVGVIIGVDRILDMCRTTLNVWGDVVAAKTLSRLAPD